jgi:hypothetical protein
MKIINAVSVRKENFNFWEYEKKSDNLKFIQLNIFNYLILKFSETLN